MIPFGLNEYKQDYNPLESKAHVLHNALFTSNNKAVGSINTLALFKKGI